MANAKGKSVDTTCLSFVDYAQSRLFIHRDYLAHCLRYSHAVRYLFEGHRFKTDHILDVGCGRETPLPRLMFSMRMTHTTGSYTGVDYSPVPWPEHISKTTGKFKASFHGENDFVEWTPTRKSYDLVTSFEVLEHVEAEHAFRMLKRMRELCAKKGRALVSTPCYDPKVGAADNHVNEMSYWGFRALIEAAGWAVDAVWGTFASQKDYKKLMTPAQQEVFDQLVTYYDSNVVSCLMAPMFPEQARNCVWRLRPDGVVLKPDLKLATPEHGSSTLWPKHLKEIAKEVAREAA